MSTFKEYLTESAKSYDYKIKVAGQLEDGFATKMETALQKFEVAKMSAGKKTPIMTLPLDFPALSNEEVNIFDVFTNYRPPPREMKEYLGTYMNIPQTHIVVRKPGEPTEEYQETKSEEYETKLTDSEYKDAPDHKAEDHYGDAYNMSMLKALMDEDKGPKEDRQAKPVGGESKEDMKGMQADPEGGKSVLGNK